MHAKHRRNPCRSVLEESRTAERVGKRRTEKRGGVDREMDGAVETTRAW